MVWKIFFKTRSATEHGTLYQLKNLIKRSNVRIKPKSNFDACDDFLKTVITGYILALAMSLLGMETVDDMPKTSDLPPTTWLLDDDERRAMLHSVTQTIVNSMSFGYNDGNCTFTNSTDDGVFQYAQQLINLGCFYLEYDDAVKEGDGERVLRCWRYLLLIFKNFGRKNYAKEALMLLCQHDYFLPSQLAKRLLCSKVCKYKRTKRQKYTGRSTQ